MAADSAEEGSPRGTVRTRDQRSPDESFEAESVEQTFTLTEIVDKFVCPVVYRYGDNIQRALQDAKSACFRLFGLEPCDGGWAYAIAEYGSGSRKALVLLRPGGFCNPKDTWSALDIKLGTDFDRFFGGLMSLTPVDCIGNPLDEFDPADYTLNMGSADKSNPTSYIIMPKKDAVWENVVESWTSSDFRSKAAHLASNVHLFLTSSSNTADILFRNLFGNIIKTVSKSGAGKVFMFDEDTCLWQEMEGDKLDMYISRHLQTIVDKARFYTLSTEDESDTDAEAKKGLAKLLDEVYKKVALNKTDFVTSTRRELVLLCWDPTFEEQLDRKHRHLLPTRGGNVFDLRTGETRRRTQDDLFTTELNVAYAPNSPKMNEVRELMRNMMLGNEPKLAFVKRLLGYLLTGETADRGFYFFVGKGRNGKSFLLKLLKAILGGMYAAAAREVVVEMNSASAGSHTSYLCAIANKRVAANDETKPGDKCNQALMKAITGGGEMSVRESHGKQQTVLMDCKVVLATNFMPEINEADQAVVDRMRFITFEARFVDEQPVGPRQFAAVKNLDARLSKRSAEFDQELLDAAFSFCAEGAMEYYSIGGLAPPACVLNAQTDMIKDLDDIRRFVDEALELGLNEGEEGIAGSYLYQAYAQWHSDNAIGREKKAPKTFGERVKEYVNMKKTKAKNLYLCRLKTADVQ